MSKLTFGLQVVEKSVRSAFTLHHNPTPALIPSPTYPMSAQVHAADPPVYTIKRDVISLCCKDTFALGLQSNGEIISAGVAAQKSIGFQPAQSSFALARYTSTGLLDTSFGSTGKVITAFGSNTASISALVLQPDGKIVVAGDSGANVQQSFVNNIVVARYLAIRR